MPKQLEHFHKCYLRRLNWLNSEIANRDSKSLLHKLQHALAYTYISSFIFQDFLSTAVSTKEHLVQERDRMHEERDKLESHIRRMEESVSSMTDQELKESQSTTVEHMKSFLQKLPSAQEGFIGFNILFMNLNVGVMTKSLSDIYQMSDSGTTYAVAKKLLEHVLMLASGGWLLSGLAILRDTLNIIDARAKQAESADSYLAALDAFIYCTAQWCIIGQFLTDSVSGIRTRQPASIEDAAKKVEDRFSSFLRDIVSGSQPPGEGRDHHDS